MKKYLKDIEWEENGKDTVIEGVLLKGYSYKGKKESKKSDLPSPTPLRFSKAERFDN